MLCTLVYTLLIIISSFKIALCKSIKEINYKQITELKAAEIIEIPVTFFLGQEATAQVSSDGFLYYSVKLCPVAIQKASQASLYISVPENPTWTNLDASQYIMLQVSVCKDSFIESCVIALNYYFQSHTLATPNVTWNIGNETEYYIRVLAGNSVTQFSMELSFASDMNTFYYNWTTDLPFNGPMITGKTAIPLTQYWKSEAEYTIVNQVIDYVFSFGYCDEGQTINGINVAITTSKSKPFSLIQQWACSQSVNADDCTQNEARAAGWFNPKISSFNLLSVVETAQKPTDNGVWVVPVGEGAESDQTNSFFIQASLIN